MPDTAENRKHGSATPGADNGADNTAGRTARRSRRVIVHGLEIMASVGVFEVEHRYEQRVIVSLDLDVADSYDGISERLQDVLDYSELVKATERIAQSRHFKLIETLAEVIAAACLKDGRVDRVVVRIEKPDVIANCRSVGIEIERRR